MKAVLKCDIQDKLIVSADLTYKSVEKSENVNQQTIRINITPKDDEQRELASRLVPWPAKEALPNEMVYSESENCVKLQSSSTIVTVPMRVKTLLAQSFGQSSGVKKYKTFSANPTPSVDVKSVLDAIRQVISSNGSEKKWKALTKSLTSLNDDFTGVVSPVDQIDLLAKLKECKLTSELESICNLLSQRKIFGYKGQQDFFTFCIEHGFQSIVTDALHSNALCSEVVLSQMLKYTTSLSESEAFPILETILTRGFCENTLTMSARSTLSPTEVARLIEWCTEIYNDSRKQDIATQALALLSALIDSHGSRLVWDDDVHETLNSSIQTITDLAALADVFATFEAQGSQAALDASQVVPLFRLRNITLPVRKVAW